jgi:hypothetical protein
VLLKKQWREKEIIFLQGNSNMNFIVQIY